MEYVIILVAPLFVGVAVWLIIQMLGEMIVSFFTDLLNDD